MRAATVAIAAIVTTASPAVYADTPDAPPAGIGLGTGKGGVGDQPYPPPRPPLAATRDAGPAAAVATSPAVSPDDPTTGSNEELAERYGAVKAELNRYKAAASSTEKRLAIFGMLGAVAWLLIAAIKRVGKLTQRGKRWLPLVAAGLGVAVGAFTYLGAGQTWTLALFYGAGPWLAPFIQEVKNALWPGEPTGG